MPIHATSKRSVKRGLPQLGLLGTAQQFAPKPRLLALPVRHGNSIPAPSSMRDARGRRGLEAGLCRDSRLTGGGSETKNSCPKVNVHQEGLDQRQGSLTDMRGDWRRQIRVPIACRRLTCRPDVPESRTGQPESTIGGRYCISLQSADHETSLRRSVMRPSHFDRIRSKIVTET